MKDIVTLRLMTQYVQVPFDGYRDALDKNLAACAIAERTVNKYPECYEGHRPSLVSDDSILAYFGQDASSEWTLEVPRDDWLMFRESMSEFFIGQNLVGYPGMQSENYQGLPFFALCNLSSTTKFLTHDACARLSADFGNVKSDGTDDEFKHSYGWDTINTGAKMWRIFLRLRWGVSLARDHDGMIVME